MRFCLCSRLTPGAEFSLILPIPRHQRLIIIPPFRPRRSAIRTDALKPCSNLPYLAFCLLTEGQRLGFGIPRQFLYSRYLYPVGMMPARSAGRESRKAMIRAAVADLGSLFPRSHE